MNEPNCTLSSLHVHPVKSCAGLAPNEALLIETGLEFDRAWMVVDEVGEMLTQRELPRLALIRPTLRGSDIVLRAPGMLALHIALDAVEEPTRVRVWDDEVSAYTMGALAAQWFSDFLGRKSLRLVRFDPEQKRLSSRRWTGAVDAENAFADGFPLLVASTASLADLNQRLAAKSVAPVTMERFRPNLVLDGLEAYDEDHLDELTIHTEVSADSSAGGGGGAEGNAGPGRGGGIVKLKLVKPCARCSIPNVDPASADMGHEPGDTLAGYRANPVVDGGITFGMNAIILEGIEQVLRPGQRVTATWRFD